MLLIISIALTSLALGLPRRTQLLLISKNQPMSLIIVAFTTLPALQLLAEYSNYIGVGDNVPVWEKDLLVVQLRL